MPDTDTTNYNLVQSNCNNEHQELDKKNTTDTIKQEHLINKCASWDWDKQGICEFLYQGREHITRRYNHVRNSNGHDSHQRQDRLYKTHQWEIATPPWPNNPKLTMRDRIFETNSECLNIRLVSE